MDLLSTILTCSLYLADDAMVRAIAESNSQSNPYFVFDAGIDLTQVDPPPTAKNTADAAARAEEITARGGRPRLGLLELPPAWLSAFGRELVDAFDPCINIAIGTAMLSQFDAECAAKSPTKAAGPRVGTLRSAHAPSAKRRRCVLEKYEEAIGLPDFRAVTTLELRYQRPKKPSLEDAPIFAPETREHWGPDHLLVHVPLSVPILASPKP
jgi:hypothetical protein